ncbi:MAG: hypothetical protein BZ135_01785 [Methanosphaera sp. rholeuAM6]|nr:MAG: hypothetical protein BZ135_01785 [Methanosphaera sp. rholeuAM6]
MNLEEVKKLYTPIQTTKTLTTEEYKEKYVNLEVTLKACRECPNYSQNWACPEFNYNPLEKWDKYANIELIYTKIKYTPKAINTTYNMEEIGFIIENTLFLERNKLIPQLEEKEKQLNGELLSAGYCGYCEKCARIEKEKCKYPDKCHNSIESIGGLAIDTIEGEFNEEMKWIDMENGKLPENLSLLMAILY